MTLAGLEKKNVAVWGGGREGVAAARFLRKRFPQLHITLLDEASCPSLPDWINNDERVTVKREPVTLRALLTHDVVIRSPGVSVYRSDIIAAKQAGLTVTSGTNIWFGENVAAQTICVTGSKGKSTTTHLICHLLTRLGLRAEVVGNIGRPLIDQMDANNDTDIYVVELSSYQLSDFEGKPTYSLLLNLFPEHLDWHGGEEAYYRDKANILWRATAERIVNALDVRASQLVAGLDKILYFNASEGFHHTATELYFGREHWLRLADLKLLGTHNLSNICAAATAVSAYYGPLQGQFLADALRDFEGLPHRLMLLGVQNGIYYVDDSIATIPEATIAAMRTFSGRPITVLVGGFDRGLDQRRFAEALLDQAPYAIITLPDTGNVLSAELQCLCGASARRSEPILRSAEDLVQAVSLAGRVTPPGGLILLSPGAPSYNSHKDFADRGNCFAKAAGFPAR